jgi:predicted CopG family antitoxin
MTSVTLLHPEQTFTIPALQTMTKCSLFQNNPRLLASSYQIQSSVSLSIFREFISALEGNTINITDTNYTELKQLCEEFGFSEIAAKLSEFRPSVDFKEAEDANARGRIAALEEKANQHSHVIAIWQDKVTQLSTDFERLVGEVSALRSVAAGIQALFEEVFALKTQIGQNMNDPFFEQLSTDFIELRKEVLTQKRQIAAP